MMPDLDDYDPRDEPADMLLCTVRDCDRVMRAHVAQALRAQLGDLEPCERYDLGGAL